MLEILKLSQDSSSWAYYFQVDIMPSSDIGVGQSIIGFTPCIDLVWLYRVNLPTWGQITPSNKIKQNNNQEKLHLICSIYYILEMFTVHKSFHLNK